MGVLKIGSQGTQVSLSPFACCVQPVIEQDTPDMAGEDIDCTVVRGCEKVGILDAHKTRRNRDMSGIEKCPGAPGTGLCAHAQESGGSSIA